MVDPKLLPLTILLDIDGTLIGDITPQVILYELLERLKIVAKQRMQKNINKFNMDMESLQSKLQDGVIRPHFKSFFKELMSHGVEIFIYTASEKKWAEFLIKNVEQCSGVKFNRPLFTRNNCKAMRGELMKSINSVKPAIVKSLNRKYNAKFTDCKNRIMAIDNKPVYVQEDLPYLVLCKTYKYRVPENIPAVIKKDVYEKYASDINYVINMYHKGFKEFKNYLRFEKQFYFQYIDSLSNSIDIREECHSDNLFKIIMSCILHKNIQVFNDNAITYINNKLKDAGFNTPRK
jgi:hypothetical protein